MELRRVGLKQYFLLFVLLFFFSVSGEDCAAAPAGRVTYEGHMYQRIDSGMTWTQAREHCASLGGHLATITSQGEQQTVQALIAEGTQKQYWLGGTVSKGHGTWITGEAFSYSNWAKGEPNNYRSNENYIQMYRLPNPHNRQSDALGKWNDISNDNHISGEEDFFTTAYVGMVCEFDEPIVNIAGASVSLSKTSYTYDGKAKKPSVTVVLNKKTLKNGKDYTVSYSSNTDTGKASVQIKGIGAYTGSSKRTFSILPKKVGTPSAESRNAGKLTVSWAGVPGNVSGYQIRYSKNKNFSINTVKKVGDVSEATLSGLTKNKKYYVQVRAYKNAAGTYLYGRWSISKSVTVPQITVRLDKTELKIVTLNGRKASLRATVIGGKGNEKIKWRSSDTKIITVKDGALTASGRAGTAVVTAHVKDASARCTVKVQDWMYVTKKITFKDLGEWKRNIQKAEASLFPLTSSYIDPVSGKNLMGVRVIQERKVLGSGPIKHTYVQNGKKRTLTLNCPNKIRYKISLHIHNFRKGYGQSGYIGNGGVVLINQCSCGYRSEWTWEIPDLTEMDGSQTTATVTSALPKINKK